MTATPPASGLDSNPCLQERYAPSLRCFGCGPANPEGLHVRSFEQGDGSLVATWRPGPHHEAFPGVLNGGIIGTLLDCHCNWAAAIALMRRAGADRPPCTVTAEYTIRMKQSTPAAGDLRLVARVVEIGERSATVDGELSAGGEVTATCRGVFVSVKPGHPAYHRW
jgi:acyl-coenzyme A thioesterase PaaI-like protein